MIDPTELTRVVVADDHPLVIEWFRASAKILGHFTVVGAAGTGNEALRLVASVRPDVLVLDARLPDLPAAEVARQVLRALPRPHILVFTAYDDPGEARALLALGVDGFLRKTTQTMEVIAAIRAVAAGRIVIDPRVARSLAREDSVEALTTRELAVLRLLMEGKHNAEIGEALGRSEKTIEGQVTHLMAKLGTRSRTELVLEALRRGLVGPARTLPATDEPHPHSRGSPRTN